jgi:hypothetical protein
MADFPGTDNDIDGSRRKIGLQFVDKRNGRIARVSHPEDNLEIGVILPEQGSIIVVRFEIGTAERDKDGDGRITPGGRYRRLRKEPPGGKDGDEAEANGSYGQNSQKYSDRFDQHEIIPGRILEFFLR